MHPFRAFCAKVLCCRRIMALLAASQEKKLQARKSSMERRIVMKKTFSLLFILGLSLLTVDILLDVHASAQQAARQVASSSDDAEEFVNGDMYLNSSDLEFMKDEDRNLQSHVGIRFTGIQIPQGATISKAHIILTTDEPGSNPADVRFYGEATDNAAQFTASFRNLSLRQKTTASVDWMGIPTWVTIGKERQTPELSSIIQEIVTRPGWRSGNSLVLLATPLSSNTGPRTVVSYDGNPSQAPLLHVEYTTTTTQLVRFAALGDTGNANCGQYIVARALKRWCTDPAHLCDFILLLGDNIYPSGASTCTDPQFNTKFEDPYGPAQLFPTAGCIGSPSWDNELDIPFYVALGNHDYGSDGAGDNWAQARSEYLYADLQNPNCATPTRSGNFRMLAPPGSVNPYRYYDFIRKHVHFFAFDTNPMTVDSWLADPGYGNGTGQQHNWVTQQEQHLIYTAMDGDTQSTWKIAFGHHPYISNGLHGKAGEYDRLSCATRPWGCGARVKESVERMCRHGIDLYLSGHDHNLQWLWAQCDSNRPNRIVEFIVSGAGIYDNTLHCQSGFLQQQSEPDALSGAATGLCLYYHCRPYTDCRIHRCVNWMLGRCVPAAAVHG